jgi:hypothetical protein
VCDGREAGVCSGRVERSVCRGGVCHETGQLPVPKHAWGWFERDLHRVRISAARDSQPPEGRGAD